LITITRSLARKFRALLRRAGLGKHEGQSDAFVHIIADSTGLRLRSAGADIALEYRQPGELPAESLAIPVEALAIVEGRSDDAVTIESSDPNRVTIGWTDRGVPQLLDRTIPAEFKEPTWPELPTTFTANPAELWMALRQEIASTDRASSRYALGCLQLRGSKGEIVATDGQQIFTHAGFEFPWSDDVLIEGNSILGCKDLDAGEAVAMGQTGEWVTLAIGHWIVSLKINRDGRFPRIDDCIPAVGTLHSHLTLSPEDAEFLAHALPSLPKQDDQHDPVTLDLNGRVIVRGKADDSPRATELVLTNSRLDGEAIMTHSNRKYLARALKLGFNQVHFTGPGAPVLCYDDRRRFLWAVLDQKSAIPASADAISIVSPVISQGTANTTKTARKTIVRHQHAPTEPVIGNTAPAASKPQTVGRASVIDQATALYDSLRSTTSAAHQLLRSLKQQKRQTRIVESTLASLKQLQKVAC